MLHSHTQTHTHTQKKKKNHCTSQYRTHTFLQLSQQTAFVLQNEKKKEHCALCCSDPHMRYFSSLTSLAVLPSFAHALTQTQNPRFLFLKTFSSDPNINNSVDLRGPVNTHTRPSLCSICPNVALLFLVYFLAVSCVVFFSPRRGLILFSLFAEKDMCTFFFVNAFVFVFLPL